MKMEKFYRLVAVMTLIMIVNPVDCAAIDDFERPDEKLSPAQAYYNQIPEESEYKLKCNM